MSPNFDKVKGFYDKKLWSIKRVKDAVVKLCITEEEFEIITGEVYVAA